MTTQSKIGSPVEVAHERKSSWLLAIGILLVGIALGVFASNLPTPLSQIGISGAPRGEVRNFVPQLENQTVVTGGTQVDRARQAEAARYSSLGQYYAAGYEANVQRAVAAESARYNGLAGFYGIERGSERAIAAEAARYTSLASYYTGDMANVARAMSADSARYHGLAGFYGAVTGPQ